ncbi:hypothetical protein IK110_01280 [Candidatus Saccharibacteria bacterium]|nr:hypothetical protein [Candidatus Saccharibacteria bacterium]
MANRATPKQKKNGRGKGVAFAKWAKIDKAQRNMLISVCVVSVFLGITLVGVIYFAKVIAFNAKVISEKDKIISNYKSIQTSLQSISSQVSEMSQSERLEAVARTRSTDCTEQIMEGLASENGIDDVELARTCTALRVIPDALPSKLNQEATLASLNQLLNWSNNGIGIESISGADVGEVASDDNGLTVSSIGASISLSDAASNVRKSLSIVESSIRNFDIVSANISWVDTYDERGNSTGKQRIELTALYRAYYANGVKIEKKSKKICADDKSDKCTGRRKK